LICRRISTARYAFYGSPDYAARHGLPGGIGDLGRHQFVIFERANRPSFVRAWLREHVPNARIVQTFTEHELMDEAVAEGQGLGVLNVKSCEGDAKYVRCFDPIEDFKQEHVLLVAPEAYRRAEVKAFVKFFAPRYAAIYR
jgi:DNA-binding transcriptional LysR family regulator